MKSIDILIVDYGLGNLYSVNRALEVCGATNVSISSAPEDIEKSEKVILPGVGAFGDGMRGLRERALIKPLLKHASEGKPLLGICLGMQMLASSSDEFGLHQGLDLIPGKVHQIPKENSFGIGRKNPYVGWANLIRPDNLSWDDTVLRPVDVSDSVYLVHSYHMLPDKSTDLLASYSNMGELITAAVRKENITGLQFHPEKSGNVGLSILRNFINQLP